MNSSPTLYYLITLQCFNISNLIVYETKKKKKNLDIIPTMEENSLHGKVLGSYSKHDSHLRLWCGECEVDY